MTDATALLRPAVWQDRIFNGGWIASHGGTHTFTEPATGEQLGLSLIHI